METLHLLGGMGAEAGLHSLISLYDSLLEAGLTVQGIDREDLGRRLGEKSQEPLEFRVDANGKEWRLVFTNSEDIPSRQEYFSRGGEDYVPRLAEIAQGASYAAMLCNTASAPEKVRQLARESGSLVYDWVNAALAELPGGKYLSLSTSQLDSIGSYGRNQAVDDRFYERLTEKVINGVKAGDYQAAAGELDSLLATYGIKEDTVLGLNCTELPVLFKWARGKGYRFTGYRTADPQDSFNKNIVKLLSGELAGDCYFVG